MRNIRRYINAFHMTYFKSKQVVERVANEHRNDSGQLDAMTY